MYRPVFLISSLVPSWVTFGWIILLIQACFFSLLGGASLSKIMPAELLAHFLAPCVHIALCWLIAQLWEGCLGPALAGMLRPRLDPDYFLEKLGGKPCSGHLLSFQLSLFSLLSFDAQTEVITAWNSLAPQLIFSRSDMLWTFQGEHQQVSYPELFSQAWASFTRTGVFLLP